MESQALLWVAGGAAALFGAFVALQKFGEDGDRPDAPRDRSGSPSSGTAAVAESKPVVAPLSVSTRASISSLWERSFDFVALSGDVPRMMSRMVVQDGSGVEVFSGPELKEAGVSQADMVGRWLECCARHFGELTDELVTLVEKLKVDTISDVSLPVKSSFEGISATAPAGETLRTVSVNKLLGQGIVMLPASTLKKEVAQQKMAFLKDVREAEGWTVLVVLRDGSFSVRHTRLERSAAIPPVPAFEVKWSVEVEVQVDTMSISDLSLRLEEVTFADGVDAETRASYEDLLNEIFTS